MAEPGFVFEFGAVAREEDMGGDPNGFAGVAVAFHAEDLVEAGVAVWDEFARAVFAAAFGEVCKVGGAVFLGAEEVTDIHFRVIWIERVGAFFHAPEDLRDVLGGIPVAICWASEDLSFGPGSVEGEILYGFDGRRHLNFGVDEEVRARRQAGRFELAILTKP